MQSSQRHAIHHILPIPSILSIPSIPFISSFHLLLGVIMICICEPRDASASSFNRLRSVHTIMIFVVPASTDHHLWTMAIKTPDTHNHYQEMERDQLAVTRKSPEPFSTSGWLPVRIALPDYCRRGWAPTNQRAHIILLWELISVSRSAHFRIRHVGSLQATTHNLHGSFSGCQLPWRFVVHVPVAKPSEDTLEC